MQKVMCERPLDVASHKMRPCVVNEQLKNRTNA